MIVAFHLGAYIVGDTFERVNDLTKAYYSKENNAMRLPVTVVLDNLRSMYNVGALFRTVEAVGAERLLLCGFTPFPPRPKINKVSRGMEEQVAWEYYHETLPVLQREKARGSTIVALEQTKNSVPYDEVLYPFPCSLVVGFEVEGIADSVLEEADITVSIPMIGQGRSLNVVVALGVVLYEIVRQQKKA
ncbi:MAG: TrmH family RNA methyltransferase [bacterium]